MTRLREWLIRFWGTLCRGARTGISNRSCAHISNSPRKPKEDATARMPCARRSSVPEPWRRPWRRCAINAACAGSKNWRVTSGDASRALRRTPAFSAVVILTLAIGIGANTAVFSLVNGVLLKPLAYPKPDELVAVWQSAPGAEGLTAVSGGLRLSESMYFTYAEQNRTFTNLGVWCAASATITGTGQPEEVREAAVSDGLLQALGVQPAFRRWLSAANRRPTGPESSW